MWQNSEIWKLVLVKYTVGKLISGVISLVSMSIPNVFLKNAILSPIGVFAFLTALRNKLIQFILTSFYM